MGMLPRTSIFALQAIPFFPFHESRPEISIMLDVRGVVRRPAGRHYSINGRCFHKNDVDAGMI